MVISEIIGRDIATHDSRTCGHNMPGFGAVRALLAPSSSGMSSTVGFRGVFGSGRGIGADGCRRGVTEVRIEFGRSGIAGSTPRLRFLPSPPISSTGHFY